MFYHVTKDSFGDKLPVLWFEIADTINKAIDDHVTDDMTPDQLHDLMNEMWARYYNNHLYWYYVCNDEDDLTDLYGSFNLETAFEMYHLHKKYFPNARIRMREVGINDVTNIPTITDTATA